VVLADTLRWPHEFLPPVRKDPAGPRVPSRHARLLWEGPRILLGHFHADSSDRDFQEAGPIGDWPEIAFPRTAVLIHQEGGAPFVADPTLAVFYNPRQAYRRRDLTGSGDRCEWLSFDPGLLPESGSGAEDDSARPFRRSHAPISPGACLLVRRVSHRAAAGEADPLEIEESLMHLLGECLGACRLAARDSGSGGMRPVWVREAKTFLAARFDERLTLTDLSRRLGLSPYYLCRLFLAVTGQTLHAYRNELRLRASLVRLLESSEDLTPIALELGFSSHSHFTSAFRRKFGLTPSRYRSSAGRRTHGRAVRSGR
jgi:AraC family transcriptional regulator